MAEEERLLAATLDRKDANREDLEAAIKRATGAAKEPGEIHGGASVGNARTVGLESLGRNTVHNGGVRPREATGTPTAYRRVKVLTHPRRRVDHQVPCAPKVVKRTQP